MFKVSFYPILRRTFLKELIRERAQRDSAKKTSQTRPDGIRRQAKVSLSLACQLVGAGVVPGAPVIAPPPTPAASRINWAISSGCTTYDA